MSIATEGGRHVRRANAYSIVFYIHSCFRRNKRVGAGRGETRSYDGGKGTSLNWVEKTL